MQTSLPERVENSKKEHLRHKRWQRVVTALACVVVFCTTYALILPALTMTDTAYCGHEEHTHSAEDCYERVLVCGQEEGAIPTPHEHTEVCYELQRVLACGQEESAAHTHSAACYAKTLSCGLSESAGHSHSESCYTTETHLSCGMEENDEHTHDASCYTETTTLSCGQAESEGHSHGESCYTDSLSCGLAEGEGHTHNDSCYREESVLVCTAPTEPATTEGHVHTDECYEEVFICDREEHTHTLSCFSDPNADVESAAVWERTLPQNLGDNWAENVIAVAESQLGYTESTANYTVLDDGATIKGYTRYGAWYGVPYGDWCAMFVSFCLHYAGVPETAHPYHSACNPWVSELSDMGLYENAEDCYPEPGFLIFFDTDADGHANHVGLVSDVSATDDGFTVYTIEGNSGNMVAKHSYNDTDSRILGYGVLPENPDLQEALAASEDDIRLVSQNEFRFTDTETGLSVTLTLEADSYSPADYYLQVEPQALNNYENALKTFSSHGQEIAEAIIYKIFLVNKQTGQSFANLNSGYTLDMRWDNGLFTEVTETDELRFTYCRNPKSEPTEFSQCDVTYGSDGNVTSTTVSDYNYPNSAEFLFVRLKAAERIIAGQYELVYNDVRDCFLTAPDYAVYYKSNSPLGTAGSFHIVAFGEARLNTHTNGNVLAKNLYAYSNFGTNNLANELSYAQNYLQVHSVSAAHSEHILAFGSGNTVALVDNGNAFSINGTKNDRPYHLVQDRDSETVPLIDLARVEAEITQISAAMRNYPAANLTYTSAQELGKDHSRLYLNKPSGVGVVSYSAAELREKLGGYVQVDGFQTGHNGTVIINVDCTGTDTVNMPQARVVIDGQEQSTSEVTEFYAGKVIWNFVNARGVTINTHLMTGAVIAPGATVNIQQNLNGTVVAENINVNAESHRTDFTGRIEEPEEDPEPEEHYISVRKIKTGYAGTALPGAEFDLYQWANGDWTRVNEAPLITGSSGTVMLRHLTPDVAYKLVETKAPDQYTLTSEVAFFWLRTNTGQTAPTQRPEDFVGQALDTGSTLQIANDPSDETYVSISVNKVWLDESGQAMEPEDIESIEVILYQDDKELDRQTLGKDNEWSYTWTELEPEHEYRVEELEVEGYKTTCVEGDDGTWVITNQKKSSYVLPETGGIGTWCFTLGGVIFIAGALSLGCITWRKRE